MSFDRAFSDAYYTVDLSTLGTVPPERPQHPPYSPLWPRFHYQDATVGLLLWKNGTVKVVDSLYTDDYLSCDDVICGGTVPTFRDDDWQVQVLRNAGYTLTEVELPR